MTDAEQRDEQAPSTAEREGIVDQQDAVLETIEEIESPDTGDDGKAMEGEAPTG
jgi:hypothetical protein